MRTKAIKQDAMDCVLHLLTPANALACKVALAYGLRIGDVLAMKTVQVLISPNISIREQKTGKWRRFTLSRELRDELIKQSGHIWVFEHRTDRSRHRTRQAVYKDIKRAAKALRLRGCVGTHSMRKTFAKRAYGACPNVARVQRLFNHSSEAVTMLYVLADEVEF